MNICPLNSQVNFALCYLLLPYYNIFSLNSRYVPTFSIFHTNNGRILDIGYNIASQYIILHLNLYLDDCEGKAILRFR